MRHLRLLRGSTGATPEPNRAARCLPKDAPASQPLREHAGQKSRGCRRLPQQRNGANELCQRRLVARSRRLNVRGGQRSNERKRLELSRAADDRADLYTAVRRAVRFLNKLTRRTAASRNESRLPFLSGLAVNLGFEGLLAANINLDLLGLGFGLLGELDLQHALVVVGAHLPLIHGTGQCERAGEASVLPLNAAVVLFLLFLLDVALAMDGEGIVVDVDMNVLFVDARDFKLQSNVVLVFVGVHRRYEAGGCQRLFRPFGVIRLTEKAIHAVHTVLHGGKLTERFPTGQ